MKALLIILTVLFVTLIVVLPLVEKYAPKDDGRSSGNLSRFIFPLVAVLIIAQIVRYYFF